MSESYDLLTSKERVRTDLHCTECSKNFIAELDHSIDGNHIVECPYCGHEHCRVIIDGKITSERWDSRSQRIDVDRRRVWKHNVLNIKTSTASSFIRDKWLNFGVG
jgi:DNA-directed RNA polymerase subunit RPC12/RpoP